MQGWLFTAWTCTLKRCSHWNLSLSSSPLSSLSPSLPSLLSSPSLPSLLSSPSLPSLLSSPSLPSLLPSPSLPFLLPSPSLPSLLPSSSLPSLLPSPSLPSLLPSSSLPSLLPSPSLPSLLSFPLSSPLLPFRLSFPLLFYSPTLCAATHTYTCICFLFSLPPLLILPSFPSTPPQAQQVLLDALGSKSQPEGWAAMQCLAMAGVCHGRVIRSLVGTLVGTGDPSKSDRAIELLASLSWGTVSY